MDREFDAAQLICDSIDLKMISPLVIAALFSAIYVYPSTVEILVAFYPKVIEEFNLRNYDEK